MGAVLAWSVTTDAGVVHAVASERRHGDFHLDHVALDTLDRRRRALVDRPWTMLAEEHGTVVRTVVEPGDHDGESGDALVTASGAAVLGIWAGDCAPLVLVGADGVFAAVHVGWRGLAAGIVDVALDALAGHGDVTAWLGPRLGPCCNEFGEDDLARVARGVGLEVDDVRATTGWGSPALDVPTAVRAVLARSDVALVDSGRCTGCDDRWYSHRVRRELGRHVVAAWREAS